MASSFVHPPPHASGKMHRCHYSRGKQYYKQCEPVKLYLNCATDKRILTMFTSTGMRGIAISLSVCLLAHLKNHLHKFHQIFCTRYLQL